MKKILVIEDESFIRDNLIELLEISLGRGKPVTWGV